MKNFTILFFFLVVVYGWAQPTIQWQKTYGSSAPDIPQVIIQTADGGYLVSGYSYAGAGYDKSEFKGQIDYWIIRLDVNGNKLWDKTIGGSFDDFLSSAIETSDGGYLLGGYSSSPVSGDKSGGSEGGDDYWIVKIDGSGNIIWDETIGSPNSDRLFSIVSMGNGNYALGGYSDGLPGGDKSAARGGYDYWLVMISDTGNILWDKVYGGSSDDVLQSMASTNDQGLIMAGYSFSSMSYDKTENPRGSYDYWVVKTDADGNKQWDRTLGGSAEDIASTIVQAGDGSFLVGGYSRSPSGFDKTETPRGNLVTYSYCTGTCSSWPGSYCCSYGYNSYYNSDYWIVKLSSAGSRQWDRVYGSAESESLRSIAVLSDGYVLTGDSYGYASYNKTENSKGGTDNWTVKINFNGNKLWDKTIGGNSSDYPSQYGSVAVTKDGGYVLASQSYSGVSGDKTEASKGQSDYWIVKFTGVADIQAPVITNIPSDVTVNVDPGSCSATVNWIAPTATDNIGVTSFTPSHLPGTSFPFGNTTVTYTAKDAAGNTSTASFIITVVDNEAPVPSIAELPAIIEECGYAVTEMPNALDNCSKIIATTTDPLSYSNQGIYSITWTYDDGNGNISKQTQKIDIKDITSPTITGVANIVRPNDQNLCGAKVIFTDPVAEDNCGLQSFTRTDNLGLNSDDLFLVGTTTIAYEAIDLAGNVTTSSFDITITNEVPVITSIDVSLDPRPVGVSIPVSVSFLDNNAVKSSIAWGDGSVTEGNLGTATFTGDHIYTTPGVYTMEVKLTDACEVEASSTYQYIVIYDPYGGFVTGGGWFDSPEGAYVYNPQANGKASFGFVSKYQKGSSVPVGNTDFQFMAGGVKFKSTSYDWLVVAGYKAMYKGLGELNGSSGYGFLISAVDGEKNSSTAPDKFRIKIWDSSGSVVYDNQMGNADGAEAATAIGGGSIVIHDDVKSKTTATARTHVSINETLVETEETAIGAYPNPFMNNITVEFHSDIQEEVSIQLLDITGKTLYNKSYEFSDTGLYLVDVTLQPVSQEIYLLRINQCRRIKFLKMIRK